MFISDKFQTKSLICLILVVNVNQLLSQNIGCIDPNNSYYDENADIGYFSGVVEGGSECNQSGWESNYIGINLEYYLENIQLFQFGTEINFDTYTYFIDAVMIPPNCNSGVALIYIVTEQNMADNDPWTFQQDIEWPFIATGSAWTIDACECHNIIDCDNICGGNNFACIGCQDGDVNFDDKVDIFDIIQLSDCILNNNCNICNDLTNDSTIDNEDILYLQDVVLNWTYGCLDQQACNFNSSASWYCDNCCEYESIYFDCDGNCLIDDNMDGICDNIPYEEFFVGMNLPQSTRDLFITNAIRFEEICLNNFTDLKNPLWTIHQTGNWPIYYHVESWEGLVNSQSINNLTSQFESIANDWLDGLQEYDSEAPSNVSVKIFGFVFNEGVEYNNEFYNQYSNFPLVTNYTQTNEESPWVIRFRENDQLFDQNWYAVQDYLDLYVDGNRDDFENSVLFFPNNWNNFLHPEGIDIFVTKFWHKVNWDAVAQRQFLKIGGQIHNYETGEADYRVFAHEMGHCFFLDDIYDPGKYPNGLNLISIMNTNGTIADFDKFLLRLVWKNQKEG